MSRLDELIQELCPDGVEYKAVKDIAVVGTGNSDRKESDEEGKYPFYVRSKEILRSKKYLFDETAIVIPGEGGVGDIFHYVRGKYDLHQRAYRICFIDDGLDPKYAYYYFCNSFKKYILKKSVEATVTSIRKPMIENFRIPVPSLSIQREIVRILDTYTELMDKLTAELDLRKKQYIYYAKHCFEMLYGKCEKVPISSLGKWSGGKTPSMAEKTFWKDGTIPWITSKDMKMSILKDTEDHIAECALPGASMTLYPQNCTAIVTRSGILKHTFPVAFVPFKTTVNQDIKMLSPRLDINPKYAFYVLKAYSEEIRICAKKQGGTVDSLDFQKIMDYEIPLPSLDEQNHIVSIFDRFDSLCNDITNGLPAEIAARQKQYEYYRDKLLSFKEKRA